MISIQGKSGLFLHLLIDIAKFTAQTKAQALLLLLLWISSISSLTLSYQNVWSVANVYCYGNIESRFGQSWDLWLEKFENKDQENLVLNLWRQNLHHKLISSILLQTIGCRWERGISDHQIWYLVIVCS